MKGVITPRGVREESAKVLQGATAQLSLDQEKKNGDGEQHANGDAFEPFGRELAKRYWRFEEDWVNLNHGESVRLEAQSDPCCLLIALVRQDPTALHLSLSLNPCTPSKPAATRPPTGSCVSNTSSN